MAVTKAQNDHNENEHDAADGATGGVAPEGHVAEVHAGGNSGGYPITSSGEEGVATRGPEGDHKLQVEAKKFMDSKAKALKSEQKKSKEKEETEVEEDPAQHTAPGVDEAALDDPKEVKTPEETKKVEKASTPKTKKVD